MAIGRYLRTLRDSEDEQLEEVLGSTKNIPMLTVATPDAVALLLEWSGGYRYGGRAGVGWKHEQQPGLLRGHIYTSDTINVQAQSVDCGGYHVTDGCIAKILDQDILEMVIASKQDIQVWPTVVLLNPTAGSEVDPRRALAGGLDFMCARFREHEVPFCLPYAPCEDGVLGYVPPP